MFFNSTQASTFAIKKIFMCGLFSQHSREEIILLRTLHGSANIKPKATKKVKVGAMGCVVTPENEVKEMMFGFMANDSLKGDKFMFNARAEGFNNKDNVMDYAGRLGIHTNPFSKTGIANKRVIIPVVNFVEGPEKERLKKPFEVKIEGVETFYLGAFSGIDSKKGHEGFCIVTCWPNAQIKDSIGHHRSPVILSEADAELWRNPETDLNEILNLMKPFKGAMQITPLFIGGLF